MQKNSSDYSMEDAARLAQTPAGQQLLSLLQQDSGRMQQALAQAQKGDQAALAETLRPLLSSPQIRALLKQLGG